ncbi:MAG: hypothetical protein HRU20_28980 [Pseudomonadales bacterium]|nr:hypothetical protein [Pseudomonadales bacterium]
MKDLGLGFLLSGVLASLIGCGTADTAPNNPKPDPSFNQNEKPYGSRMQSDPEGLSPSNRAVLSHMDKKDVIRIYTHDSCGYDCKRKIEKEYRKGSLSRGRLAPLYP